MSKASLTIMAIIVTAFSCTRNISDPVSPPINDVIPDTPVNLSVRVGDGNLILSWIVADTQSISKFRVYEAESSDTNYTMVGEPLQPDYTAAGLRNGFAYFFRVSSVSKSGFEGYRSDPIAGVPNLYAVSINGNQEYTNSRDVALGLTAPDSTRLVQISEDSTFADVQWDSFFPTRSWRLTSGDGTKTVYVRFRDIADHMTIGHCFDSIDLDTETFIDSVTFSPSGSPLSPGSAVHFKLFAGEPDGHAGIAIAAGPVQLALYDDGSRGDAIAGDGTYERDYIIADNLDFENGTLLGNFVDRAGNTAEQATAAGTISVRRAPDAVSIYSITAPNSFFDRLELGWSESNAADFAQYRVYRSASAGVDSSDYLVRALPSVASSTVIDTGLVQTTRYYYRVFVVDNTGLWTGSNEVSAVTNQDLPPAAVTILPVVVQPDSYLDIAIQWSQATDPDFMSYRLYRWPENVGRSDSVIVALISARGTTSFTDHPPFGAGPDTINYWYIIHTYDEAGNHSASNSVRVHLVDSTPPQVGGAAAPGDSAISVTWNVSDIPDFGTYRLLRNTTSDPGNAITVFVTSQSQTTSYSDRTTTQGQTYFYWLDIYDRRDNNSRSFLGSAQW